MQILDDLRTLLDNINDALENLATSEEEVDAYRWISGRLDSIINYHERRSSIPERIKDTLEDGQWHAYQSYGPDKDGSYVCYLNWEMIDEHNIKWEHNYHRGERELLKAGQPSYLAQHGQWLPTWYENLDDITEYYTNGKIPPYHVDEWSLVDYYFIQWEHDYFPFRDILKQGEPYNIAQDGQWVRGRSVLSNKPQGDYDWVLVDGWRASIERHLYEEA